MRAFTISIALNTGTKQEAGPRYFLFKTLGSFQAEGVGSQNLFTAGCQK